MIHLKISSYSAPYQVLEFHEKLPACWFESIRFLKFVHVVGHARIENCEWIQLVVYKRVDLKLVSKRIVLPDHANKQAGCEVIGCDHARDIPAVEHRVGG